MKCPGDFEWMPTQGLADPITRTLLQDLNISILGEIK